MPFHLGVVDDCEQVKETSYRDGREMNESETWKEYKKNGDADLREELILHYAPLVRGLARGILYKLPPIVEYSDLVSYGFLGLLDAIDKYDPQKGIDFKAYAKTRINGAIIDGIRSEKRLPRSVQEKARKLNHANEVLSAQLRRFPDDKEVAGYLGMEMDKYRQDLLDIENAYVLSLEDLANTPDGCDGPLNLLDSLQDENALDPSDVSEKENMREIIREAINHLPEREKIILALYYYEDLNMKEVGEVLNITESRVSQIHTSAVAHLRSYLSSRLSRQPV
jgi:RNA polymerase sigma factor for flagellar operon FliA